MSKRMKTHTIKWTMDHFLIWLFRIHGSLDTTAAINAAKRETRTARAVSKAMFDQGYHQGYEDCKKALLATQPLRDVPIARVSIDEVAIPRTQTTLPLPKPPGELLRVIGTEHLPAVRRNGDLARLAHSKDEERRRASR